MGAWTLVWTAGVALGPIFGGVAMEQPGRPRRLRASCSPPDSPAPPCTCCSRGAGRWSAAESERGRRARHWGAGRRATGAPIGLRPSASRARDGPAEAGGALAQLVRGVHAEAQADAAVVRRDGEARALEEADAVAPRRRPPGRRRRGRRGRVTQQEQAAGRRGRSCSRRAGLSRRPSTRASRRSGVVRRAGTRRWPRRRPRARAGRTRSERELAHAAGAVEHGALGELQHAAGPGGEPAAAQARATASWRSCPGG